MSRVQNIGLIGCGKVGKAFIGGIAQNGKWPMSSILVAELPGPGREWARSQCCGVVDSNQELVRRAKLVFLMVRPESLRGVLQEVAPVITEDHVIVSVAAGVKLETLQANAPPRTKLCRVMLNLQIKSCVGTSAIAQGDHATKDDVAAIYEVMSSMGHCSVLPECNFDAFSALAGSGPAFIYGVIEALAEGATIHGLPRSTSLQIAANMVRGAAIHTLDNLDTSHPCLLREAVCTPGGSSIRGVQALEKNSFRNAFISAIEATVKRNVELGRENS